jgi:predicted AAA+ superfamily ATPase
LIFDRLNLLFHSLVIFRGLLSDKVMLRFFDLLNSLSKGDSSQQVEKYASFVSLLFKTCDNLTDYMLDLILRDDNFYIVGCGQGKPKNSRMEDCLANELKILQEISQISAKDIKDRLEYDEYLPSYDTRDVDLLKEYRKRISSIKVCGYGIYSKHHMFTVKGKEILPIRYPDTIRLKDLKGYEDERKAVIDNTLSLLNGFPAANVLLYGDAGTGKSSTVKAVANEYKSKGLRLIEIRKDQLHDIPAVMDEIYDNCLKFILYIDDLSFTKNSDEFGALKAVLEGSVAAKPRNTAIYATSNRRHLIKETFTDREGDDIHVNDTIQELSSLSERFGMTVCFERPDREQYLEIIDALIKDFGLKIEKGDLYIYAERYALIRGGRSPRIARQLVEHLVSSGGELQS